jgi:cytidylate kinase
VAVITFSREPHSGTQDLARLLADRLGYRYVGIDELTRAVTERSGVERTPQTSENEGRALSLWEQLGEHLTGDREAYTTALRAVTTDLAAADNVVIVGHGAGLFLSDKRSVVRVFVVAPIEDRVARLIAESVEAVVDPDVARRLIEQRDRESAEYIRHAFGIDWLDPHHWDLVVNTGRANPHAAVDMLMYYTQSLIRDRAEQEDLARQQLVNRIQQALLADEHLGVDRLRVRCNPGEGGAIVLEGEALTTADRERAQSTAQTIAPQAAVDNQIVVRPPTSA